MKAIHNSPNIFWHPSLAVNYTQRYKKWKQFTTTLSVHAFSPSCELYTKIQKMKAIHNAMSSRVFLRSLWTIHKDTKNESNSQLGRCWSPCFYCCELYTKIQKMKAIHNPRYYINKIFLLWTIHKDTKNESNSQPRSRARPWRMCCELYTKIQKMKAIHNSPWGFGGRAMAVNDTQRYKNYIN